MAKKTGFLVGALLGAAAALVTAPKAGKQFRKDVKDFYEDYKENPTAKLQDVKDIALNFYDDKSEKIVDFSVEKFNDIKEKFDNGEISADKVKSFLTVKQSEIKEKIASGELSKEKVIDLLAATKDKVTGKVTELKSDSIKQETEKEEDFSLELQQEDLIDKSEASAEISDSTDESL